MTKKGDPRRKIISIEDLEKFRETHRNKKIVFTVGCFDILHHGHIYFFNDCANLGDILVVGIARDATLQELKGPQRPINKELNRLHLLSGLEHIDYVLLNEEMLKSGRMGEYAETKIDFKNILEKLSPDVFVLGEDTISSQVKKKVCGELGIEVVVVGKDTFEGTTRISSSNIVEELMEKKDE